MNINNFHENIPKLENDTAITKSKMFSYKNISQNDTQITKSKISSYETDDFQAVFEFLDTGPSCDNIKSYQNNKKPKSYSQDVKPRKKAKFPAIDQVFM